MKTILQRLWIIVILPTVTSCTVWNYVKPKPELLRNLPSNISQAEAKFDRRVKQQFPLGSSERELVRELKSQDFQVRSFNKSAVFKTSNLACRLNWIISWKTDTLENITKIDGDYNTVCL